MNERNPVVRDARTLGIPKMLLLGLQHMFAMFGATILVPILVNNYFMEKDSPFRLPLSVPVSVPYSFTSARSSKFLHSLDHPSRSSADSRQLPIWIQAFSRI